MKFKVNNNDWEIKEINFNELNINNNDNCKILGLTRYIENTIYIANDITNIEDTLKHELCHCWMEEYGHNQAGKEFNCEDVCEIVSKSNKFINEIVKEYKLTKK